MMNKINSTAKQLYFVFLFNYIFLLFLGFKYLKYTENISTPFSYFYIFVSLLGHCFLLGILPLVISLLFLYTLRSALFSKIIFCILSTLVIIYLQIDTMVYSQFRYHLSPIVFKLAFGKRATDIFQFSSVNIIISVLFIVGLLLVQFSLLFIAKKLSPKIANLRLKLTLGVMVFFLLYTHLIFAWSDANRYRAIAQMKNIYPVFFPLTAESLMLKMNLVDPKEIERNALLSRQYSKNLIQYPFRAIISEKKGDKNILIIVIDSWRFDNLNEQTVPNIYNLSQKSQLFQNHKSGSNMTTGGIFSLFYGIPATYYEQFTGLQISPIFFNELQKQHYELSILSSSTIENPPFNKNVFSGIKNLRLESKGNSAAERDQDIYAEWNKFIDSRNTETPFFSFLFFDAAHGFDYPAHYPVKFTPTLDQVNYIALNDDYDPLPFYNRYKNSLHFIDSMIGELIKKLEEKNLLESTIVVITGDHGQEFNDNKKGYWQHGGNFSNYQIGTPLLVYDFSKSPQRYTHLTLHYDIVPTLMSSVLGVSNTFTDYSVGQSLYNTNNRDWFICGYREKYAIIEKNRIINIDPAGMYEAVDKDLNALDDSKIDFEVVKKAVQQNSRFYNIPRK